MVGSSEGKIVRRCSVQYGERFDLNQVRVAGTQSWPSERWHIDITDWQNRLRNLKYPSLVGKEG